MDRKTFFSRTAVNNIYREIVGQDFADILTTHDDIDCKEYIEDIGPNCDFDGMWLYRLHDTGLVSKKGIRIFLTLIPFHAFTIMNANEDEIYSKEFLYESTGGFCLFQRGVSINGHVEDIYCVLINYDMYRTMLDLGREDSVFLLISHEIGHCINDHSYTKHKRTTKREKIADITGLNLLNKCYFDLPGKENVFTNFVAFNQSVKQMSLWTRCHEFGTCELRAVQHITNYVSTLFGYENLCAVKEFLKINFSDLAKKILNIDYYFDKSRITIEDKQRLANIRKWLKNHDYMM